MSLTGDQFEWLFKWYRGATKNGLLVGLNPKCRKSQLTKQKVIGNERYLAETSNDILYPQNGSSPGNSAVSESRTYGSAMTNRDCAELGSNCEHWQTMVDINGGCNFVSGRDTHHDVNELSSGIYRQDLVETHMFRTVPSDIDDDRSRFDVGSSSLYPAICFGTNDNNMSTIPNALNFPSYNDNIAVKQDQYTLLDFVRDLSKLPMMDEDLCSTAAPDKMNSNKRDI
ncbi:hypothetical protein GG344DRAFT_77137 [Lentinula edodes]|nr:hypothetical protein GG344DRAFT_77137 [Lentinula edodes]